MSKGAKIIIGIIIAIVVIIAIICGVYFVSFSPSVATTPINKATANSTDSNAISSGQTEIQNLASQVQNITGNKTVNLNSQQLSNMAAYAISQSPSASKYISGVKVEPKDNHLVVYLNAKSHGVPAQAKLTFNVGSQNGKGVLHYDSGKVGFVSIPRNEIFDRLRDNGYIKVNKTTGDITITPSGEENLHISNMNVSNSNLNVAINKATQELNQNVG